LKFITNDHHGPLVFVLLVLLSLPVSGQDPKIKIKADGKALNEVLITLREDYGLRFSFDHQLLSTYPVTADSSFTNSREAINFLIKGLPLDYKRSLGTYIFFPVKPSGTSMSYRISGRITDRITRETLPYTHVICGNQLVVSDQNGNFSLRSETDSLFSLTISYLGYLISDTLLGPGMNHQIQLTPALFGMQNVVIRGDTIRLAASVTSHPGEVRLNPRISNYLPGNGDHSLFNLLRLQPGILAAGEQSNDLIIWGCYEGQSQVLFDGFTLYGLKNFNDQISAVNPLLIKDIRIIKGGFEPRYGNRVGGIVDITGYDGNTDEIKGDFILNNMTANGMLSVPVSGRSSLLMAFRNTYYNLYNSMNIDFPAKTKVMKENPVDISVVPDYTFRDVNLKYSGSTKRGDRYAVHFLYGTDTFSYHVEVPRDNILILDTLEERNRQQGASGNYQFRWRSGQLTTLTASYSAMQSETSNRLEIQRKNQASLFRNGYMANQVSDLCFKLDNRVMPPGKHTLEYGAGSNLFGVGLPGVSTGITHTQQTSAGWLANGYIQDRVSFSSSLIMQLGIRADFPSATPRLYIQPRASLEWQASATFRLKAALGRYNQFIVKSAQEDDAGNMIYFWALADNLEIPVVDSRHLSFGGYLDWKTFQIHTEAWYKTYDGITRFKAGTILKDPEILHGKGRGFGADFYVQKQIGRHTGWVSYSLARTIEHFPNYPAGKYLRAPQDQTHELKIAALLNFHPVYLSANYVYGSGFPNRVQAQQNPELIDYPYSRFDAALTGRFAIKKTSLEAGFSVLNIFNTQNIKVSNFVRIPLNPLSAFNIQAEAIPITPTLFLKFSF